MSAAQFRLITCPPASKLWSVHQFRLITCPPASELWSVHQFRLITCPPASEIVYSFNYFKLLKSYFEKIRFKICTTIIIMTTIILLPVPFTLK